jgi:hypothetical protein
MEKNYLKRPFKIIVFFFRIYFAFFCVSYLLLSAMQRPLITKPLEGTIEGLT